MSKEISRSLSFESDIFIGKRSSLRRYLICPLQGHFPVAVKTGANSAAVIFRTGAAHLGITGTLAVSVSNDGGKCWTDPAEINERWEDCRNPAFGVNKHGELVAAFWKAGFDYYETDKENGLFYSDKKFKEKKEKGLHSPIYIKISKDSGKTWTKGNAYYSKMLRLPSPYGRMISLPDGTLLMSAYGTPFNENAEDKSTLIMIRSYDGGKTWKDETFVASGYNETSFVYLDNNTLLAAARSDQKGDISLICSYDSGKTWTGPKAITRKGEHPADLIQLKSGRVLLTFGRRIFPMGCGALLSSNRGVSWNYEKEILLAGDGRSFDLGYPSTVQFDNGDIMTALYYAGGSEMSTDFYKKNWGDISCQAIHYREKDIE